MVNVYVFPRLIFSFIFVSEPKSEMCTSPEIPSSILASAPYLLNLMMTACTVLPFLYFFSASVQGFVFKALIERETFPSFTSITFTFTLSPILKSAFGSSTSDQSISEICTSPSSPSSSFTNTPKSTAPVMVPESTSPTLYLSTIFCFSFFSRFFPRK